MIVRIKNQKKETVKIISVIDYFCLMLRLQQLAENELKFDGSNSYYTITSKHANGKLYSDGVEWD